MAREVEVNSIIDLIRILCEDPQGILANGQAINFLDLEFARLYAMYVQAEPDRFRVEQTFTVGTTPPTNEFELPEDWMLTIAVDYISSPTVFLPLERLQEQDRNRFNDVGSSSARAYRLLTRPQGSSEEPNHEFLVLYPVTLLQGQKYRHIYIPSAPKITSLGQFLDCRNGHEKYLAMTTARMLLNTENTYDGRWDDEIAEIVQQLQREANYRYFHDVGRMSSEYEMRRRSWPFNWPAGWASGRRW